MDGGEMGILPIVMEGKEKTRGSILLLLLAIAALNQAQSAKKCCWIFLQLYEYHCGMEEIRGIAPL